jgi:hypothetical protein
VVVAYLLIGACNVGLRRSLVGPSFISCTSRPCPLRHKQPNCHDESPCLYPIHKKQLSHPRRSAQQLRHGVLNSTCCSLLCLGASLPPGLHTRRALAPGSAVPPSHPGRTLCVRLLHPSTLLCAHHDTAPLLRCISTTLWRSLILTPSS